MKDKLLMGSIISLLMVIEQGNFEQLLFMKQSMGNQKLQLKDKMENKCDYCQRLDLNY